MKTTVFAFHPDLTKGSRVNQTLPHAAREAGVEVRDLYRLYPDFQIDVAREQTSQAYVTRLVDLIRRT